FEEQEQSLVVAERVGEPWQRNRVGRVRLAERRRGVERDAVVTDHDVSAERNQRERAGRRDQLLDVKPKGETTGSIARGRARREEADRLEAARGEKNLAQ